MPTQKWLYKCKLTEDHPGFCEPYYNNWPMLVWVDSAENIFNATDFPRSVKLDDRLTESIRKDGIYQPLCLLNGQVCRGYSRIRSAMQVDPKMEVPYFNVEEKIPVFNDYTSYMKYVKESLSAEG